LWEKSKDREERENNGVNRGHYVLHQRWRMPTAGARTSLGLKCSIPKDKFKVGLIQSGRPTPISWVGVHYPPARKEKQADKSMGLCVKPLHNQYNRVVWLVEFIQLYNLLG
jgi:hypothetical protein